MFQKIHLYLTALCAGITAAIMIVMSLLYLYLSEKSLYENQYRSFQNDISTIATNLEQQTVLSMEWLSKMEARGGYTFFVMDNEVPLLYNKLADSSDAARTRGLIDLCLQTYKNQFEYTYIEEELSNGGRYNTCFHAEFPFNPGGGRHEFYAGVIELSQENASLQMVVLSPLSFLHGQIITQRIHFLLIDGAALLILTLFSFFFTGRLLRPIIENRQKQNAFVAAASHELRTPLSVILSAAECCRDAEEDRRNRFLDTIRQEGEILTSLVNNMLSLSASDSKGLSFSPAPTELDTLLMNAYEAFEPLAAEKGLTLKVFLPENPLPPCKADQERIFQLLSILLHNAISYTPKGGSIELSLRCQKKRFYISASDTGIGIPPEDRQKIFDRFYRAEKSRSLKGHFGLGLSIASEIVKLHHGTITVSERPGGGSIFTVMLPG